MCESFFATLDGPIAAGSRRGVAGIMSSDFNRPHRSRVLAIFPASSPASSALRARAARAQLYHVRLAFSVCTRGWCWAALEVCFGVQF